MAALSIFKLGRSGAPEDPLVVESSTLDYAVTERDASGLVTKYTIGGQARTIVRATDGSIETDLADA